jgi:hypothetical protein
MQFIDPWSRDDKRLEETRDGCDGEGEREKI